MMKLTSRAKLLLLLLALISSSAAASADSTCVILLHGLGKSEASMGKLERALAAAGYATVNVDYPSTEFPIEVLARRAIPPALERCRNHDRVNFVTHSMGGILVRQYLHHYPIDNLARVVMLGPPNHGSEVVDLLGEFPGFHFLYGDAGLQLGTDPLSVPNRLGAAEFDLGIIAGTRSINLLLSQVIPASDDGKVSVQSTKLEGMNDHLEMPVTHVFMMQDATVIEQVVYYLQQGKFRRDSGSPVTAGN